MITRTVEDISRATLRRLVRMYPFYRGLWRIVESPLCHRLTHQNRTIATRLWKGPQIFVELNDYCGRAIYFGGAQDRRVEMFCAKFLRSGDAVMDIGGNNGVLALRAAAIVGPTGTVHSFEPQPNLAASIRKSGELNGFTNLTVHSIALSDHTGEAQLGVPKGNSGTASLERSGDAEQVIRVPIKHAGEFLATLNLSKVRLLKIDVEGHEFPIFKAATQWLQTANPDAIVFESLDHEQQFFERPVVKLLVGLGYGMHQVKPDSWIRPVLVPLRTARDVRHGTDFVAVRSGVDVARFCSKS